MQDDPSSSSDPVSFTDWQHAPSHLFVPGASYFITSGTYQKKRYFDSPVKLDYLLDVLFHAAREWNWKLEAWALMANHYHLIAVAPEDATTLKPMLQSLHSKTARWLNQVDDTPGRKVWYQYRDTCLTIRSSYLARLNYVHNNPVKHGLVESAENYRWCSMHWFLQNTRPGFRRTVQSFKIDKLNIEDNYD